jgi:hypothetical protein
LYLPAPLVDEPGAHDDESRLDLALKSLQAERGDGLDCFSQSHIIREQ